MTAVLLGVCVLGAVLTWRFGRHRLASRAAFYVFTVLAIFLAIAVWQERAAPAALAGRGITPYPGFDGAVWVPALPGAASRTWMFHTADSFRTVADYYRDAAHRPGWTLAEDSTIHLYLRKAPSCVQITFGRNLSILTRGKTTAIFTFSQCEERAP